MKLKEYLPSLIKMARLSRLTPARLNQPTPTDLPLIVSCTSIPSRFKVLDKTIKSVLSQTTPPKRMVLWLHERHEKQLPASLTDLVGTKFSIRFTQLDSPHCKLVPSLEAYPSETIVTCDDDLMYEPDWLETLWQSHLVHPKSVIAHIARIITKDESKNEVLPYKAWPMIKQRGYTHEDLLPLGFGGVLYPTNILPIEATNSDLYLKLAPKADDLWFRAIARHHGIEARTSDKAPKPPYPMPNSQTVSLKKTNVREDGNRIQWQALAKHFDL
ncbi:MAG: hypothetical protein ACX931_07055 [Saccharospirillum sp.]